MGEDGKGVNRNKMYSRLPTQRISLHHQEDFGGSLPYSLGLTVENTPMLVFCFSHGQSEP